ncbi:MAG: hypothetical protein QOJ71_1235, partial [Actinomycetota bacterium]|nr:hypothetical protein [Actinomycetota bacterium]
QRVRRTLLRMLWDAPTTADRYSLYALPGITRSWLGDESVPSRDAGVAFCGCP